MEDVKWMQSLFAGLRWRTAATLRRVYGAARSRAAAAKVRAVKRIIAQGRALDRKVAVVTGASSGIGLAMVAAFARAGGTCVLVAIDEQAGSTALKTLVGEGLKVELAVADVTNPSQVAQVARDVARGHDRVDILVNNAGVFLDEDRQAGATGMDHVVVERTLAVNLFGAVHTSSAFVPLMAHGGRIINVSSVMGQLSRASDGYAPAYRLSKAALNSYTQSLAANLRGRQIMVDAFHPGFVRTAIGGPIAEIDPEDAIYTAFFLATRPYTDATGLFWWDCQPIRW